MNTSAVKNTPAHLGHKFPKKTSYVFEKIMTTQSRVIPHNKHGKQQEGFDPTLSKKACDL